MGLPPSACICLSNLFGAHWLQLKRSRMCKIEWVSSVMHARQLSSVKNVFSGGIGFYRKDPPPECSRSSAQQEYF